MLRDPVLPHLRYFQDPVKSLTRYFLVPFLADLYSVLILLYTLEAVQEYLQFVESQF